jgi:hypothetical protein
MRIGRHDFASGSIPQRLKEGDRAFFLDEPDAPIGIERN